MKEKKEDKMNNINVIKIDGINEKLILKVLDISYIDEIVQLEQDIFDGLDVKELYATSTKEEFREILEGKGKIVGAINSKNKLVAMGVYVDYGYNEHNYGYDLDLHGDNLLAVGQIESTIVRNEYRGNNLQYKICTILEGFAKEEGKTMIAATVSPKNPYSLNTFLKLGYTIEKEKIKYEGLNRYILKKNI